MAVIAAIGHFSDTEIRADVVDATVYRARQMAWHSLGTLTPATGAEFTSHKRGIARAKLDEKGRDGWRRAGALAATETLGRRPALGWEADAAWRNGRRLPKQSLRTRARASKRPPYGFLTSVNIRSRPPFSSLPKGTVEIGAPTLIRRQPQSMPTITLTSGATVENRTCLSARR